MGVANATTRTQHQYTHLEASGASYGSGVGSLDAQHGFNSILAALHGVPLLNHSIGGATTAWSSSGLASAGDGGYANVLMGVTTSNQATPYLPQRSLCSLAYGFNDLWQNGRANAVGPMISALRLIISRYRSAANLSCTHASFSASTNLTQQNTGPPTYSQQQGDGSTWLKTTASPATRTFTVPADVPAGAVPVIYGAVFPDSVGTITFTKNGAAQSAWTITLANIANASGTANVTNGWCARLTGAVAGDVIVATITYSAGNVSINGGMIEAPTSPVVLVQGCPHVPANPVTYGWANQAAMWADIDTMNTAQTNLVAEFDAHVRYYDTVNVLGTTAYGSAGSNYVSDNLHPTPGGHSLLAQAAFQESQKVILAPAEMADTSLNPPYRSTGPASRPATVPSGYPYQMTQSDQYVSVTTSGARTVTLPDAVAAGRGAQYQIGDDAGTAAAGNITIGTVNSQTIEGRSTFVLSRNYGKVAIASTGTQWTVDSVRSSPAEWQPLHTSPINGLLAAGSAQGTYVILSSGVLAAYNSAANGGYAPFYLDAANWPNGPGGLTAQVRITGWVITNAVAQTGTFTFQLVPVSTWGGASAANPIVTAIGAATVSAAVVTPVAAGPTVVTSTAANIPAAGWFVPVMVLSVANVAANGQVSVGYRIEIQRA